MLPRILAHVGPDRGGPAERQSRRTRAKRFARRAAVTVADGVHEAAGLLRTRQPYVVFGTVGYMALDVAA